MDFAISLIFLFALRFGRLFTLTLLAVGAVAALLLLANRFSVKTITVDQRWAPWQGVVDVFRVFSFFRIGNQHLWDAVKGLGITFDFAFIPHSPSI